MVSSDWSIVSATLDSDWLIGWTALHWAAKRNHLNIVNKLLNHGADRSIKTNKGELPAALTSEGVIKVYIHTVF